MENTFKNTVETPIGYLEITSDMNFLLSVTFSDNNIQSTEYQPHVLIDAKKQIDEYFRGVRKEFKLNLKPSGTDFQNKVWEHVEKIPYGNTVSYLDIAIKTGSKNNTRAVGLANGKNPLPIIIPCHRVVGVNGKLTGYAGGLERKKWLLEHELQHFTPPNLLF